MRGIFKFFNFGKKKKKKTKYRSFQQFQFWILKKDIHGLAIPLTNGTYERNLWGVPQSPPPKYSDIRLHKYSS